MVRIGGREDIICCIGPEVASRIIPVSTTGYRLNRANNPLCAELTPRVRIGFDVVLASGPSPVRMPGDAFRPDLVDISALTTRSRAHTPHVIVKNVAALGVAGVLAAECLGDSRQGGREGEYEDICLHL